eukprot:783662-Amphidinium_carterae.1
MEAASACCRGTVGTGEGGMLGVVVDGVGGREMSSTSSALTALTNISDPCASASPSGTVTDPPVSATIEDGTRGVR